MSAEKVIIASPCDTERQLIGHLLRGDGLDVVEVATADEVIGKAQASDASLIILDALSCDSAVLNALKAIKSHQKIRGIPVLVFGQPSNPEQPEAAIGAGAAAWVDRKGFQITMFVEKVRSLMRAGAAKVPSHEAATQISSHEAAAKVPSKEPVAGTVRTPANAIRPLSTESVQELLAGVSDLAAFDFNVTEAITTTCGKEQIADLISDIAHRDPMLAVMLLTRARLLQADSRLEAPTDLREAAASFDARSFCKLAESVPTLKFDGSSIWDAGHYWMHSVATSRLASMFSQLLGLGRPTEAALAGLLHDIGYVVLSQLLPQHYGALFTASRARDCISPAVEQELIGVHHGQLGALALKHFGLPGLLQDVAAFHEMDSTSWQSLKTSSRVVTMLVQAADQIAKALFPGDPPLIAMAPVHSEFEEALDRASLPAVDLMSRARTVIMDLLTELLWLFPQSDVRAYYYKRPPLSSLLYYSPGKRYLDVMRLFLEVRSRQVLALTGLSEITKYKDQPLVVNLSHVTEPSAQIEALTGLLSVGTLQGRRTVVLLCRPLDDAGFMELIPQTCRVVATPSQPARWIRWLAASTTETDPVDRLLSVA